MNNSVLNKRLVEILSKYPVSRAALFGSFARGTANKNSDIDILIETSRPISLFLILNIENEIKKATKKKADIVEYSAIKPSIRKTILNEAVRIL